jgi:hypothetical protein
LVAERIGPAALALIAGIAILVAGCGEEDQASDPSSAPETQLTVSVDADGPGPGEALTAEVACPGDPAPVCGAVDALPADPGEPVPPQTPCTEVYGGPDALTVNGTLRGEPITAGLSRENGCEIERFERFKPLLSELFPDYSPGSELGA